MAEELEIKLTVAKTDLQRVQHWLSNEVSAEFAGDKALINRYFDTPAAELNRNKAALRVRQAGDRYIQTLKTRGDFVHGAHRRQEWEWPLPGPELDLDLLADTPLAGQLELATLDVVFETNFRRRIWLITRNGSEVEVALDSGVIASGGRSEPLNEVEFELKSGDARVLMSLARELADQIPVFLNLVSKAEQGYFLAGLYQPRVDFRGRPLSVTDFLYLLSVTWLLESAWPSVDLDLSEVEGVARSLGVEADFEQVTAALVQGMTIRELAAGGRLGRVQLPLASA